MYVNKLSTFPISGLTRSSAQLQITSDQLHVFKVTKQQQ
jgi:hypothetical protein